MRPAVKTEAGCSAGQVCSLLYGTAVKAPRGRGLWRWIPEDKVGWKPQLLPLLLVHPAEVRGGSNVCVGAEWCPSAWRLSRVRLIGAFPAPSTEWAHINICIMNAGLFLRDPVRPEERVSVAFSGKPLVAIRRQPLAVVLDRRDGGRCGCGASGTVAGWRWGYRVHAGGLSSHALSSQPGWRGAARRVLFPKECPLPLPESLASLRLSWPLYTTQAEAAIPPTRVRRGPFLEGSSPSSIQNCTSDPVILYYRSCINSLNPQKHYLDNTSFLHVSHEGTEAQPSHINCPRPR